MLSVLAFGLLTGAPSCLSALAWEAIIFWRPLANAEFTVCLVANATLSVWQDPFALLLYSIETTQYLLFCLSNCQLPHCLLPIADTSVLLLAMRCIHRPSILGPENSAPFHVTHNRHDCVSGTLLTQTPVLVCGQHPFHALSPAVFTTLHFLANRRLQLFDLCATGTVAF